jgi:hypothetical protein
VSAYYDAIGEDPFKVMPMSFHVKDGLNDKEFLRFTDHFSSIENQISLCAPNDKKCPRNIWIVKPGEDSNRGTGINVVKDMSQVKEILKNPYTYPNGKKRSYIIQKYIDKPFLFYRRKFDIRVFVLVTSINGNLQGYWY